MAKLCADGNIEGRGLLAKAPWYETVYGFVRDLCRAEALSMQPLRGAANWAELSFVRSKLPTSPQAGTGPPVLGSSSARGCLCRIQLSAVSPRPAVSSGATRAPT